MRTRWEFRTHAGLYAALPTADSLGIPAIDGGMLVARQAAALLGGRQSQVRVLGQTGSLDATRLQSLIATFLPDASVSRQVAQLGQAGMPHRRRMKATAEVLGRTGLELLGYFPEAQALHWCLVSGVEVDDSGDPTALLLIDSALPDAWACGYNARLEPTRSSGRWVRRSLDGRSTGVQAHEWLTVRF